MQFLLFQLCDSAFPTGAFAHSSGLESLRSHGFVPSPDALASFAHTFVFHTAHSALPYVARVNDSSLSYAQADLHADAFLTQPVSRRASTLQGRALLEASVRAFGAPCLPIRDAARASRQPCHQAPTFGALSRALQIPTRSACEVFLHGALRALLSSSIRLGIVGPGDAQRVHSSLHEALSLACDEALALSLDAVSSVHPMLDAVQASHDAMYVRLFQS